MTVLILDDHAPMRETIKSILSAPDVAFVEGCDGSEAIGLFHAHKPDWVLMDLAMPVMDGLQATREILRQFPAARLVVVTNHDDPSLRSVALEAGAIGLVSKEDLCDLRRIIAIPATTS